MAAPTGSQVWRDYVTDGVPASGPLDPRKIDIRAWAAWLESFLTAIGANSGSVFGTKAEIDADLAHAANSMAWVMSDTTPANNGIYRKSGGSGSGSWTRIGDLPYSFIFASNVGAGTPSAIQATTSIPVSSSALILLNIAEEYSGSAATVSFNGGDTLAIKSNSGEDVQSLAVGSVVYGMISGATFRLASDEAVASLIDTARNEAVAAKDDAETARDIAAGYASDAVSQGNVPIYATVAGMGAIDIPVGINAVRINGYDAVGDIGGAFYIKAGSEPSHAGKFQSDDGAWWELRERVVTPQMFGGVVNSYADRTANTTALNNCFEVAGLIGAEVDLGNGDWFFDDTLIVGHPIVIRGRGVNYWHAKYGDGTNPATKVACATQLVACGTFSKDYNYVACSSMKACGADRVNPSTRAGYNDGIYRMYSFTDGPGTLKDFSIGLLIQADGVKLSSFRIVPYGGGTRGIDGYNNASLVGWNSNIDFGIWNDYRKNITMEDIQAVGHWRGAGYQFSLYRMGAEASDDLQSQSNIHYRCIFQGFRGHMVRGADVFQVTTVNTGSNWAEVPYADDHPFHADTFGLVKKANNHTGSTNLPAITGVSVVTPGFLRLQFAGSITGLLSVGNEIVVNGNSGANSHNVYHDCAFFGITHPSGKMAHDQDLTDAFPMPSTMLEMSGWRGVEYTFYSPRFHGIEEVMWHFHSIQKVQFFDGQFETSTNADGDNGARLIVSPSAGSNPHATYPAGQTFLINLNAPNASTEDRIDWRPYAPVAGLRFNDGADNGFLDGNRFHWNDYEGASGTIGPFLRPPVGGVAGFKKSGFPSAANRFVYDDTADKLVQSVGIDSSAYEANFGLVTGSATSIVYKSGRKVDFTLADDAVANIALQTNGAILALGTNTPGTASNGGFASIRTGTTSQNCAIIVGANMTAEGSTVLSDGAGNGTDAKYNVSCQNGVLQIKNRKGNSETFHLELLAST